MPTERPLETELNKMPDRVRRCYEAEQLCTVTLEMIEAKAEARTEEPTTLDAARLVANIDDARWRTITEECDDVSNHLTLHEAAKLAWAVECYVVPTLVDYKP